VVFVILQKLVKIGAIVSVICKFQYLCLWNGCSINSVMLQPQEVLTCTETRHTTYSLSKSVHWCGLSRRCRI